MFKLYGGSSVKTAAALIILSGGYWVRRMRQSPRAPFLEMLCVVLGYFVSF